MKQNNIYSKRKAFDITTNWQFQVDAYNLGKAEKWYSEDFNCSDWTEVTVPKAWDLYDEGLWGYEGIGWYASVFNTPDIDEDHIVRLEFARVNYHSEIWLNGKFLGENLGGYLPFDFYITDFLNKSGNNKIIMRVDNRLREEWLPATQQVEWVQYGGILGPVKLSNCPKLYISDICINAVPEKSGAIVTAEVEITNLKNKSEKFDLRLKIPVPGNPALVMEKTQIRCPAGKSKKIKFELNLPQAECWSPENPCLYRLSVNIKQSKNIIDGLSERFGVRKIEVKGTGILLNGKPLFIKGVNRYDEYGKFGPNPPKKMLVKELREMKSAGVNLVRTHYPQSPELISLFDEMGILMMEELPLNWWGIDFYGNKCNQSAAILHQAQKELAGLIKRDKNHPSIIIWSMANECKTDSPVGIKVLRKLLRETKCLDKTRLATFVAQSDTQGHQAFEDADLICYNMYLGSLSGELCYHKDKLNKCVKIPSIAHMKKQHAHFPDKPKLITEFGCRAIKNISGDLHLSEDFQSAYLENAWKAIRECEYVSGCVLWAWADYYHHKKFHGFTVFGPYGVVTVDRKPKKALLALKRMYCDSME